MTDEKPRPAGPSAGDDVPFPESLCHRCAAPIKFIRTRRSTFLYCPALKRYPPQPVSTCEEFTPRKDAAEPAGNR